MDSQSRQSANVKPSPASSSTVRPHAVISTLAFSDLI